MNRRERIEATIRGTPTDRMPFAPRLDLWYRANQLAGTLPAEYRGASLFEILDDLGWACRSVVPDYKDLRTPNDDLHKAIGVYNLWMMPTRTIFENVDCSVERRGEETSVEYRTPVGTIRTGMIYTDSMLRAGITSNHVSERAVKSRNDYEAIGYLFENARVEPNYDGCLEYAERVADRGLPTAFLALAGSPMHLLLHVLMPFDLFFYEMHDHPEELVHCAERIGTHFERVIEVAAHAPAPAFLIGENYDTALTPPPFFRRHILPWQQRFARRLHAENRLLINHTDGENAGLLDLYLESEIDVADSVCTAPMTGQTLKQVRDRFQDRITIIGGIPSISLLAESMPDRDFEAHLDELFEELGAGDHLIVGVADTTPPATEFDRLKTIARRVEEFGPVRAGGPRADPPTGSLPWCSREVL